MKIRLVLSRRKSSAVISDLLFAIMGDISRKTKYFSHQQPTIKDNAKNEAFGREIMRHYRDEINSMNKFMTSFVIRYLHISVKNCLYKLYIKLLFTNKGKTFHSVSHLNM